MFITNAEFNGHILQFTEKEYPFRTKDIASYNLV